MTIFCWATCPATSALRKYTPETTGSPSASRPSHRIECFFSTPCFVSEVLRLAFVVYGSINRIDWRTASVDTVSTTAEDVKRKLLPMLRNEIRPDADLVEAETAVLVEETRELLGILLPLSDAEIAFLSRLNDEGEIDPGLLPDNEDLQVRIQSNPGL